MITLHFTLHLNHASFNTKGGLVIGTGIVR